MEKINTLIIDDEQLARKRIRGLLQKDKIIEIIGECKNGKEAVESILTNKIDLVFLDIQMPELNGFEVIQMLKKIKLPEIVFVTAYDNFAIKAFEVHAIDYLLKPFDDERFFKALRKAKRRINTGKYEKYFDKIKELINKETPKMQYLKRILVKTGNRINILSMDEVIRIKAEGYYVKLFTETESHLIRESMGNLEKKLDPQNFVRVHRSTIININYIKELQTLFKGDYIVILQDGEKFAISKSYQKNVFYTLKK